MEANTQNNYNRIFQYAFSGAVLFIAAIVFITSSLTHIVNLELPYTLTASILGASSLSLLYRAIKDDKLRMKGI